MSIHEQKNGTWKVRWRENGRNRSTIIHGSKELAKKIERKKLSLRDENRHLDIKKEICYKIGTLVDRYEEDFSKHKVSYSREKSILRDFKQRFGNLLVTEIESEQIRKWYKDVIEVKKLKPSTAARYYELARNMFNKASTIWKKETGLESNPCTGIALVKFDNARQRFLNEEELKRLKVVLDRKIHCKGHESRINKTHYRVRLMVLLALSTGMRKTEVFKLKWNEILWNEKLIAVSARLKNGKFRYVPLVGELAEELRKYPRVFGEDRIFPPLKYRGCKLQSMYGAFKTLLKEAQIDDFTFHGLRHTFASWYMMNGGDLYELAKILGHSNIKMTQRYAKIAKEYISKTNVVAGELWKMFG